MFSKGNFSISYKDILSKRSEIEILSYYFGIEKLPIVIHSPFRKDNNPSFGLQVFEGHIYYKDFSTGECGDLISLLMKFWNKTYEEVLEKLYKDIFKITNTNMSITHNSSRTKSNSSTTILQVKTRPWREYDLDYWLSYGITLKWLEFADVYPISHTIISKENKAYSFRADTYAYAYVEHKDNIVSIKVYQPFNTKGFKWINKHKGNVVSLWTKIPDKGDKLCICSSLKDALCLWSNTGIPSIALQGEANTMSNTAINNLKQRYNKIYVLFDNDKAGLKGGIKLSKQCKAINVVLPKINGTKDISDLYKSLQDKETFRTIMLNLFKDEK